MELFRIKNDIPLMKYGKLSTALSLFIFILSIFFLLWRGLNFSVEFTGGTVMEVQYEQAANLEQIRSQVASVTQASAIIQNLGTTRDVMIRLQNDAQTSSAQLSEKVLTALQSDGSQVSLRKVEFVGPQVGEELFTHGLTALILVIIGIMAYLALRFEWRFAVAAIIANLHDVIIILGFFAAFQWEFSLTVLAAVLAVLGYSVNESVVIFDRIRENFRKPKMRGVPVAQIIDNAITATMSRTVITHGSTEAMVLAMLFFGGPSLYYFALALTIGIIFGIYSSILVASPLLIFLKVAPENLIKPTKPKEEAVV